jgi:hypothetical protein
MRTPCQYIKQTGFTAVITPHAIDRHNERSFGEFDSFPFCQVYKAAEYDNRNQYVRHNGFQIFVNKKWNSQRGRDELEIISTTPDNWHRPDDKLIFTY